MWLIGHTVGNNLIWPRFNYLHLDFSYTHITLLFQQRPLSWATMFYTFNQVFLMSLFISLSSLIRYPQSLTQTLNAKLNWNDYIYWAEEWEFIWFLTSQVGFLDFKNVSAVWFSYKETPRHVNVGKILLFEEEASIDQLAGFPSLRSPHVWLTAASSVSENNDSFCLSCRKGSLQKVGGCPRFAGTFSVLKLKVLCPGNPLSHS